MQGFNVIPTKSTAPCCTVAATFVDAQRQARPGKDRFLAAIAAAVSFDLEVGVRLGMGVGMGMAVGWGEAECEIGQGQR